MPLGRARRSLLSTFGSALLIAGLLPATIAAPALATSPDLVISQIYGSGGLSGALYQNDYIELYNRGSAAVDLDPYSIQYASATGTGNFGGTSGQLTALPAYTLNPGAYILIVEAGGVNGSPLPNPNITDFPGINLSGTSGKVALVSGDTSLGCNGGSAPCSADALARIVDLVGYGTANFFEGSAAAPATSLTLADFRASSGATDTDNTAADFAAATPNPRTTGDVAPSVTSTSPADGAAGVSPTSTISITFSEPVTVSGTWFTINCTLSGGHTALAAGGPTTYTLDPGPDFVEGDTCTVTIVATQIHDTDTNDPPDVMAANYPFTFSTTDTCALPYTHAYDIQGSGPTAAITGSVTTQGVVVGDDEGPSPALRGFFLQDATGDGDAATSDAVFVFNGNRDDVKLGDVVRVTGTAGEFQGQTQVSASSVHGCGTGSVAPTEISLPQPSTDSFERYEGMLVRLPQTLTVTEHFQLGRFGQVSVSVGGRQRTPTAVAEPGPDAQAVAAANALGRLIVDDPTQDQDHDPILFGRGGNPLSAANTLRIGDTMSDVTGVLTWTWAGNSASGNAWRLRPVEALGGGVPDFQPANPRPAPPVVPGSLHVGAMNVLNYFTTLDSNPGSGNGPNICGPTGGQECRGANTTEELDRQRTKIVEAMAGLHAHIIGLMELQNGPDVPTVSTSALDDLISALRVKTGNPAWTYIRTGSIGTDAIKVGIAYDASRVTPVGAYALLDSSVDPRFVDTKNRPSLAQTFDSVDGGGRLTVVVNHLKSKGSDCNDIGDPDTGDGSGNCNLTRTAAARALVDWIATDPTHSGDRDVLVVGDMNAYAKEAPIDVFVDAGFQNVIDRYVGADAYSYVFDGGTGYLDHALASPTLAAQLAGAAEWHINADEPADLDYNTDFKSAAQVANLYAPDAFRASDHDPLVVGMNLAHYAFNGYLSPVDNPPVVNATKAGAAVPVKFSLGGDRGLDILFRQPTSTGYTCDSGAPTDTLETEAAGGSGLAYDAATDTYTYVWKTQKAWSSSCRLLDLTFRDGTYRTADFAFGR